METRDVTDNVTNQRARRFPMNSLLDTKQQIT